MENFNYPLDILVLIVKEVEIKDLVNLCSLNRQCFHLFKSDIFWSDKAEEVDYFSSFNWKNFMETLALENPNGEGFHSHYWKKLHAKERVQSLLLNIDKWKVNPSEVDEIALESELQEVVTNHEFYIQFIIAGTLRMSSNQSYLNKIKLIPIDEFRDLMVDRSKNLSQINIACSLQEIISVRNCQSLYENLLIGSDEYISSLCSEEVFVMASSIDPLYYDLLHYRKATLDWVVSQYSELQFDPRVTLEENGSKIKSLKRLLDFKLNIWRKWDSDFPQVDERNMDHSLILRVYAGLTRPTRLVYLSILEKLCKLLNINDIDLSEIADFVKSSDKYPILVQDLQTSDENQMYVSYDEGEEEFYEEPLFNNLLQKLDFKSNIYLNEITWKRITFIDIMDNFFKMVHWNYFKLIHHCTLRLQMNGHISPQPISLGSTIKENITQYMYERTQELKRVHSEKLNWLNILDTPYEERITYHQEPIRNFNSERILDQFHLEFDLSKIDGDLISYGDDFEFTNEIGYKKGDVVTVKPNKICYVVDVLIPNKCIYLEDKQERIQIAKDEGYLIVIRNNSFLTIPIRDFKERADFNNDVFSFLAFDNIGEWSRCFDFCSKSFIT